jgi:hypothetical protein
VSRAIFLHPNCLTKEQVVLTEDFVIVDVNSPSWSAVRPYVEAALRLEQNEGPSVWHGWDKQRIDAFLQQLPSPCSLLVAVWEAEDAVEYDEKGQDAPEVLALGCVCEVVAGKVRSIRTFESLQDEDLPPLEELEPGYEHAFELMRVVRRLVASVAWGLFTDKQTWNEWIFQEGDKSLPYDNDGIVVDKGKLLTELAQQGRCVLMGSQTAHHRL